MPLPLATDGILSLLALIAPRGTVGKRAHGRLVLVLLGLFGAALLYGDGVITPVISVFGAVEGLNVPEVLRRCREAGLVTAEHDTSYFLGRETLLNTGKSGLATWRKALFGFLSRNARPATAFFGIPPNRVVEMGAQIEL